MYTALKRRCSMVDVWMKEIKQNAHAERLGMILVHNGIVRATSKEGRLVEGMRLSYDKEKLAQVVKTMEAREGIEAIRVWINEGELKIGHDIMKLLVAGRFRTDVLPVFTELLGIIKNEIVREEESLAAR